MTHDRECTGSGSKNNAPPPLHFSHALIYSLLSITVFSKLAEDRSCLLLIFIVI